MFSIQADGADRSLATTAAGSVAGSSNRPAIKQHYSKEVNGSKQYSFLLAELSKSIQLARVIIIDQAPKSKEKNG